jgi:hypothetical protein
VDISLRNPAELVSRLELAAPERLLLVDLPDSLVALAAAARQGRPPAETAQADRIRSVKQNFDVILIWREERAGSQALLEHAMKRLDPGGSLWVIVALRKITGPKTPASHRLDRDDLVKAFAAQNRVPGREVRVTPWHVAYRIEQSRRSGPKD